MNNRIATLLCAGVVSLFVLGSTAHASTDCSVNLSKVWAGDDGHVWMLYTNGGSSYVTPSDPDTKNILALATMALMGNKTLAVRYVANSVACASTGRNDVVGVYLNNN